MGHEQRAWRCAVRGPVWCVGRSLHLYTSPALAMRPPRRSGTLGISLALVGSRMTGSARAAWQRRWWWWCVLPQAAHVQQRSHNTGWVLEATRGGPGSVVRSERGRGLLGSLQRGITKVLEKCSYVHDEGSGTTSQDCSNFAGTRGLRKEAALRVLTQNVLSRRVRLISRFW